MRPAAALDACPIYPGKRYEDWELEDPAGKGLADVRRIRDQVDARVRQLSPSWYRPRSRGEPRGKQRPPNLGPSAVYGWAQLWAGLRPRTAALAMAPATPSTSCSCAISIAGSWNPASTKSC
jgi:hypothetical protein